MKLNKTLKTIIACGGFLFVCVFITLKAHAETVVSGELPYVVPNFQSINTAINETLMDATYQRLLDTNTVQSDDTVLFYVTDLRATLGQYEWNQMYYICNPVVQTDVSGDYNYLNTTLTLSCDYYGQIDFKWNNTFRSIGKTYSNVSLLGNTSTIDISQGSYTPRYPFYLVGDDIMYGDIVVFTNTVNQGPVPIEGHATAPTFGGGSGVNGSDFLGTGADFGASLSQATMPQAPTYNNFNFGVYSPPSFDDSSILDALDSIAQILIYTGNYLVSNVLGAFSTLSGNIIKIGEYIVGVFEYIGRSIITNIQNAVQNLYENIVSLFQPLFDLVSVIREKIEYITEPFDKEEFFHQVDGNHLITACIHIESYGQQMKSILTNAQERNTFHLNITYPKPDGTSFQTMISFDWLYPLRHLYMPYLWVFTILYLFFSACRLLGYVIGGKS